MPAHDPPTVLVVEDDALLRLDLAETLQAAGFETFEAATAAHAIQRLEAVPNIKAVFTDIEMPGVMDGLALSHYVRKRWPPTLIVISSGRRHPRRDEMPVGADFLAKPYPPGALDAVVRSIHRQITA